MGEGCGLLFLESIESAKIRRAPKIYAEILGYGLSGDASHLTAPSGAGDGALSSMRAALSEAKVLPSEIGYCRISKLSSSTVTHEFFTDLEIHRGPLEPS